MSLWYISGVAATSRERRICQPRLSSSFRSAMSLLPFRNKASSRGCEVSRGRSAYARNATRFVFSYCSSPSTIQSEESQMETVVKASHRRSSSATRKEAPRHPSGRRRIWRPDRTAASARGTWPTPRHLDRPGPWFESLPTNRRRNRVDAARERIGGRPRNGLRLPRIPRYCRRRGRRSASSFLRVALGGRRGQGHARREDGFEFLKPFFHLGERYRPPFRLVRDEGDRGPADPVRVPG